MNRSLSITGLIPVKSLSARCPRKNFRPFFNGQSLLEIKVKQLGQLLSPSQILVSSDDRCAEDIAKRHSVNFHSRSEKVYSQGNWQETFRAIVGEIDTEYTLIAFVTTPFITAMAYRAVLDVLLNSEVRFDSVLGVQSIRAKLFDHNQRPLNFSVGSGYRGSQEVDPIYAWRRGVSAFRTAVAKRTGLDFGERIYLYELDWLTAIDIDTPSDWDIAVSLCTKAAAPSLLGI